jgi:hypothetical protein
VPIAGDPDRDTINRWRLAGSRLGVLQWPSRVCRAGWCWPLEVTTETPATVLVVLRWTRPSASRHRPAHSSWLDQEPVRVATLTRTRRAVDISNTALDQYINCPLAAIAKLTRRLIGTIVDARPHGPAERHEVIEWHYLLGTFEEFTTATFATGVDDQSNYVLEAWALVCMEAVPEARPCDAQGSTTSVCR